MPLHLAAVALATANIASMQHYLPVEELRCAYEDRAALEKIVDAKPGKASQEKIEAALNIGCKVEHEQQLAVAKVRQLKSPGGRPYLCFQTLSPVDQQETGEDCATVASIHEILREKKVRTGAFTPGLYNPYAFMAECKEGGHVIIMRKGEQWERMSATFPVPLNPPMRLVPGDKDQVLRDGCRGADYAQ